MGALLGLILVLAFGAAGVHGARNRLLAWRLTRAIEQAEEDLEASLEPGSWSLDHGYRLDVSGARLVRDRLTLTLHRSRVLGLARTALARGVGELELEGVRTEVRLAPGEPGGLELAIELGGTARVRLAGDGGRALSGTLETSLSRVDLDLRQDREGRLDGSTFRGEVHPEDLTELLPGGLSLEGREGGSIAFEGSLEGAGPGARIRLRLCEGLGIGRGEVRLDLEQAEFLLLAEPGRVVPALAEGVLRAPGPKEGTWLLPLRFAGVETPGAEELLAGELSVREGFLQPAGGGAPVLPALSFEGRAALDGSGSWGLTGPLSAGESRLEANLRWSPDARLDGSRLHGQLAPADLAPFLPGRVELVSPSGAPVSCDLQLRGPGEDPVAEGELFSPRLEVRMESPVRLETVQLGFTARRESVELRWTGVRVASSALETVLSGELELAPGEGGWTCTGPLRAPGKSLRGVLPVSREQGEVAMVLALGGPRGWSLELAEPLRLERGDLRLDLETARLLGRPGRGTAGPELAACKGVLRAPAPWQGTWILPLGFESASSMEAGDRLAGTLWLREGFVQTPGGPPPLPPLDFEGSLRLDADRELSLDGKLRTECSRLRLELCRTGDGDLGGTRLRGKLALEDVESLLPRSVLVSAPGGEPVAGEVSLHGAPEELAFTAELTHPKLSIMGGVGLDMPPVELSELEAKLAGDASVLQIRSLDAGLFGGRARLSGALSRTRDPVEYEGELEVKRLRLEQIPTDEVGRCGIGDHVTGLLSGSIRGKGRGRDPEALRLEGDVSLGGARFHFLREVDDPLGLAPIPYQGRGPATARLVLRKGELKVRDLALAVDHVRLEGDLAIDLDGLLDGQLEAHVASELLSRSALLAFPAAALHEVTVPVTLGGTVQDPDVDADFMGSVEGLVGKSTVGTVLRGGVDTLWATFAREGLRPGPQLDLIFERILEGGPEADECLERLIDTGISVEEVEDLLAEYRDRQEDY